MTQVKYIGSGQNPKIFNIIYIVNSIEFACKIKLKVVPFKIKKQHIILY